METTAGAWLPPPDKQMLRPIAERLARGCLREHLQAQAKWPALTDCDRLDAAFAELEERGICCRQHFSHFTMAPIDVVEEVERAVAAGRAVRGFAYYPKESIEEAVGGGELLVHYGAVELSEAEGVAIGREVENAKIGQEVAEALKRHGLTVLWSGDDPDCITVTLEWRRRRPLEGNVEQVATDDRGRLSGSS